MANYIIPYIFSNVTHATHTYVCMCVRAFYLFVAYQCDCWKTVKLLLFMMAEKLVGISSVALRLIAFQVQIHTCIYALLYMSWYACAKICIGMCAFVRSLIDIYTDYINSLLIKRVNWHMYVQVCVCVCACEQSNWGLSYQRNDFFKLADICTYVDL